MSKIVILQYSQDFSSTKKKKKFNEKLISRVSKQSVTRLPDSREAILVDRKRKKKKVGTVPNEKTMEKTRFAEYSQRHDISDDIFL